MSSMTLSRDGAMELVGHEAIVQTRYRDSGGTWTIGVGHTRAAGPPDPATFTGAMSIPDVVALYKGDVVRYANQVNRAINASVTQTQFDALVSFHYNTGAIAHSTITAALNRGDVAGATAAFDLYHSPPAVIGRRSEEKLLFSTGRYSHGGFATLYQATAGGAVRWGTGTRIDLRPLF